MKVIYGEKFWTYQPIANKKDATLQSKVNYTIARDICIPNADNKAAKLFKRKFAKKTVAGHPPQKK